jgi:deoxyribodipyrimidine photolyase-related protein
MASRFSSELRARQTDPSNRQWAFVAYDQLSDTIGLLATVDPREAGIVLVECPAKGMTRPYHKQKLALVLANQRHFALEQAARGVAVRYVVSPGSYADALAPVVADLGPLVVMRPAERELRQDLAPLLASGQIVERPHEGWLTTRAQFQASQAGPPWRMDAFYRHVRRDSGILMQRGKPVGGKFSFDAENRQPWRGTPPAPTPPATTPDAITREVGELVEERFAGHPGALDLTRLPATLADAETLWAWARAECLPHFGPFEDAMSTASTGLFHTRVSPLVNLHRLLPGRLVSDVLQLPLPLASQEGFIRQVLGWREFVRHVHEATDGFRRLPAGLSAREGRPLPAAYWGARSGLACLDRVVADVWKEGWSHHITRLMVLSNLATLLDVSPRELTDWFWVAYIDAFDWVVEPNVLAMGTFGVGDVMTTKPYVSGAAYIDRMSDYCRGCQFDPKTTCPVTPMYWAFLARHEQALAGNPRMAMPLRSLARRSAAQRARDAATFDSVSSTLASGGPVRTGLKPGA